MLSSLSHSFRRKILPRLTKLSIGKAPKKQFLPFIWRDHKCLSSKFLVPPTINYRGGFERTHYCGSLGAENEGQHVSVSGWVQTTRFKNFLVLRDVKGIVQVCFDQDFLKDEERAKKVAKLNQESVVLVRGVVRKRPAGQENLKMATGEIEIKCEHLQVLSNSKAKLPFEITDYNRPGEAVRLKYRYLDLRFKDLQQNLIARSEFVHKVRQHLNEKGFIDIETPTLFRRTPGGAREFLVPTNKSGQFYCLTQSPQQFKQLLMISGFDRYYQIARCYRDETARLDRQPEFTQIDLEMSFVNENDVMGAVEELLEKCWPLSASVPRHPIQRMTYLDAINQYGCDKPDIRFDMKINDLSDVIRQQVSGSTRIDSIRSDADLCALGIRIPADKSVLSSNEIEREYKNIYGVTYFNPQVNQHSKDSFTFLAIRNTSGNHITKHVSDQFKSSIRQKLKCEHENDQLLVLISKNRVKCLEIMGKLRLNLADKIDSKSKDSKDLLRDPNVFKFLWIVEFPLFARNEETNKLESTHHPFTAPIPEHVSKLISNQDLDSIKGLHYDLVLNGNEIAGGSIRIHDPHLQRHILANVLKEDTSQLEHLLEALEYGAPPHGGIAFGLDRLVAIITGAKNIRDVIAFPKNQSGKDLMASAPSSVPKEELDFYRIQCLGD